MIELGISLASILGAFLVDRYGYNRTIAKAAERLAPALPNKTARQIAEAAVLAANYREVDRQVAKQAKAAAEHDARMAEINREE